MSTRTLLIVTNDFPPRQGGIQSFVAALARRLPAGAGGRLRLGLPGRRGVRRRAALPGACATRAACCCPRPGARRRVLQARRDCGSTAVWFGAAAPLGLLARAAAPGRRRSGWWPPRTGTRPAGCRCPVARQVLRRIGDAGRRGDLPRRVHPRPARAGVRPADRPGAALARGRRRRVPARRSTAPRSGGGTASAARPVVVCVSRLVPRKGQDVLIRRCRPVLARSPGRALLLVGGGPDERRLRRAGPRAGVAEAGRPHRAGAGAPSCRRTTPPATSSPCPAAPGGRAGRRGARHRLPRGRRRPACRSSPGTPAARRRRCGDGVTGHVVDGARRRGGRRRGRRPARRPGRGPRRWARPAGPGSSSAGRGTTAGRPAAEPAAAAAVRRAAQRRRLSGRLDRE